MQGHAGWDDEDLWDALRRYESYLRGRSLAPITVESYMRYGRLFLELRIGDYTPRGMRPPAGRRVAAGKRDPSDDVRFDRSIMTVGLALRSRVADLPA